jgi:ribosomal protein S18 acetylase RimI-like enzyme
MRIELAAAGPGDGGFLEDMLYEALFIPPGEARPPRTVLRLPEIAHYAADWGRPGDFGLVARCGGEAVGAAWLRLFPAGERGFGYVDERTPELSMAVRPERRGLGIGTTLLERLCGEARERGFDRVSLSVDVRNPAVRLYRRLGFEVEAEADQAYTMVKDLRAAAQARRP